jgi:hypothetical protein
MHKHNGTYGCPHYNDPINDGAFYPRTWRPLTDWLRRETQKRRLLFWGVKSCNPAVKAHAAELLWRLYHVRFTQEEVTP